MLASIDGNQAVGVDVFIKDRDILARLKNLEREGHQVGARNAGQKAFGIGIRFGPILEVPLPFRQGFGLVGNFAAHHYAQARRNAQAPAVILKIIGRGRFRLPGALQIRLIVGRGGAW